MTEKSEGWGKYFPLWGSFFATLVGGAVASALTGVSVSALVFIVSTFFLLLYVQTGARTIWLGRWVLGIIQILTGVGICIWILWAGVAHDFDLKWMGMVTWTCLVGTVFFEGYLREFSSKKWIFGDNGVYPPGSPFPVSLFKEEDTGLIAVNPERIPVEIHCEVDGIEWTASFKVSADAEIFSKMKNVREYREWRQKIKNHMDDWFKHHMEWRFLAAVGLEMESTFSTAAEEVGLRLVPGSFNLNPPRKKEMAH